MVGGEAGAVADATGYIEPMASNIIPTGGATTGQAAVDVIVIGRVGVEPLRMGIHGQLGAGADHQVGGRHGGLPPRRQGRENAEQYATHATSSGVAAGCVRSSYGVT